MNGGITINVDVRVKDIIYVKKMFGILLHIIVKIENILQVLWIKLFMMKL